MREWNPHVTVATVIEDNGRFLMVEERDKRSGNLVLNQPAGHLEQDETLEQAALRETLEETGWHIKLEAVLGVALYRAPANGVSYVRTTFVGTPLKREAAAILDPDIHAVHWLDHEAILANSARMRSPLVIASIERHLSGTRYPLEFIYGQ